MSSNNVVTRIELGEFGFAIFLAACVVTCGWSPRCNAPEEPDALQEIERKVEQQRQYLSDQHRYINERIDAAHGGTG